MSELETILICILIPVYGVTFYIAGKVNLLTIVVEYIAQAIEDFCDKVTKKEEEDV